MSILDLDALEAKARKATPGPWTFTDYEGCTHVWAKNSTAMVADNYVGQLVARARGFGADLPIVENADYIAACDPTTVLALITRLRAAEARIARVGSILSDEGCDCYCDCDSDGHNADCDLCLACRIDREVSP